jgi:hypothetical protein
MPITNPTAKDQASLPPGIYRHYKGKDYQVYGLARHSESGELLVVYRPLYGDRQLWVRPLDMFTELVTLDGRTLPRFAFVSAQAGQDL